MTDELECSPYLLRARRAAEEARADMDRSRRESGLCPECGKHKVVPEVGICGHCYQIAFDQHWNETESRDDAQANVTDLDEERLFREYERIEGGEK